MPQTILLVNPNLMRPPVTPVGLDYIGQSLRDSGFEVALLDLAFSRDIEDDIRAALEPEPFLVAVSVRNLDDCYLVSQDFCLADTKRILDLIRRRTSAPIALGGVGFSIMPEAVLDYCLADLGIRGDGELALPLLARRIADGEDYRDVPGLVFRNGNGFTANPVEWPDMALLPPASRDIVDNPRYLREGGQVGFETKRGCDRCCAYCADPMAKGRRVRARVPRAVADELEALLRQGVDCFHTCDAEFNVPPEHALAVCREIERRGLGDRIRWYAYAEPSGFDDELACAMSRAGCVGTNFGADHSEDEMLRTLGRGHNAEDLRRIADLCRKHGIVLMYDLLLGAPGETPETVRCVVEFMREVAPDRVGAALGVRLYPGAPMTERLKRRSDPTLGLRGVVENNPSLLRPVFYVSEALGPDPAGLVNDIIAGDERFFFSTPTPELEGYNYNDNSALCEAIRDGHRGAYWDILRRLAEQ